MSKKTLDRKNENSASSPASASEPITDTPAPVSTDIEGILNNVTDDVAPVTDTVTDEPPPAGRAEGVTSGEGESARSPVEPPLVKRGRGRPKGSSGKPRPQLNGLNQGDIPPIDEAMAGIEPCAQLCTMMISSTGMMLGGETAAMKAEEAMLAKNGFIAYFKAKGIENVPAWVILAGSLSPYYLRILSTTPAKTSVARIFGKGWQGIKNFMKRRKNARSNSWDNTQRQNNDSQETSAKSGTKA